MELKTYKEHIGELYDLLLKQKGNVIENQAMDHEQQYVQLKSYLNLQCQLGSLKKFRFDQKFSDLLDLGDFQQIADLFYDKREAQGNLGDTNKSVYMNQEKQIGRKNECFDRLHQLMVDNIGQFYVIYQQMQFLKDKNRELNGILKENKQ